MQFFVISTIFCNLDQFEYHESGMCVRPLKDRLNNLIFKNNDFFILS